LSEAEAAKTIKAYFNAFNAHDNKTYLDTQNFPRIRINDKGRVSIVQNASDLLPLDEVLANLTKKEDGTPALWTSWKSFMLRKSRPILISNSVDIRQTGPSMRFMNPCGSLRRMMAGGAYKPAPATLLNAA
jgi:hypothetical protein